jgi:hypothetical protein
MTTFFSGLNTVADIKAAYRRLAKEYHPDLNHDRDTTRTMQQINAEYHAALELQNGRGQVGTDGKTRTYKYNCETEQDIMDKIAELLALDLPGCEVWLIGFWIWVQGDTRPVKDTLKDAGLSWHSKRKAWYWKPFAGKTRYNGRVSLGQLAEHYGARLFTEDDKQQSQGQRRHTPALVG